MLKQQSGIAEEWLSVLEHDEGLLHGTISRIIQDLGFHKFMCDGFCEYYQKTTSCKEFVVRSPSSNSMPFMVMISSNALSVDTRCWFTVTPGDKMCKHGLATCRVSTIQIIQVKPICLQSDGCDVLRPPGCMVGGFRGKDHNSQCSDIMCNPRMVMSSH